MDCLYIVTIGSLAPSWCVAYNCMESISPQACFPCCLPCFSPLVPVPIPRPLLSAPYAPLMHDAPSIQPPLPPKSRSANTAAATCSLHTCRPSLLAFSSSSERTPCEAVVLGAAGAAFSCVGRWDGTKAGLVERWRVGAMGRWGWGWAVEGWWMEKRGDGTGAWRASGLEGTGE